MRLNHSRSVGRQLSTSEDANLILLHVANACSRSDRHLAERFTRIQAELRPDHRRFPYQTRFHSCRERAELHRDGESVSP